MPEISKKNEILDRIKSFYGLSGYGSEIELAKILDIPQKKLASWRACDLLDLWVVIDKFKDSDLLYILTGTKSIINYEDVLEAVRIIEEIFLENNLNDIQDLAIKKANMVVLALKKQKKVGKSWSEMKEIMEISIQIAVDEVKDL